MRKLLLTVCLTAGLFGCGGSAPPPKLPATVPASGLITLDGKPLPAANVVFIPRGMTKGLECFGATDDSGKFTLTQMRGQPGAPPGEYTVVVSKLVARDGKPLPPEAAEAPANFGAVESLPARYSSVSDSELIAQVQPSGGEYPFKLKSR
jgi:hypothetical protein